VTNGPSRQPSTSLLDASQRASQNQASPYLGGTTNPVQPDRISGVNSITETDKLNEKCRQLRDENHKLKEMLKKSDQALEVRLTESKMEQQHLVTICNLMGPIISSITGHADQNKKPLPKTFIELIATLDDVSKTITRGGSL